MPANIIEKVWKIKGDDVGVIIYTDGSCLGNPGPGAFSCVFPDGRAVVRSFRETTNNRMEIMGLLCAMTCAAGSALIVSDSRYAIDGATKWVDGWVRKNWRAAQGRVKNIDLWKRFLALQRPGLSFAWTRGHAGDPGNMTADILANEAAQDARGACVDLGYETKSEEECLIDFTDPAFIVTWRKS